MTVDRGGARPRAYYPDGTDTGPTRARTPGWDMGPERRIDDGRTLARALGWASIGLGIFQVIAPDRVTDFLGIEEDHAGLVRLYGGREIAHMQRYLEPLLKRVENDEIDLSSVITYTVPLEKGPDMYRTFREKEDGCIKVVLKPAGTLF